MFIIPSLGENQKAIEYNEKALSLSQNVNAKDIEIIYYKNKGSISHNLGQFSKAVEHYEKALSLTKELDHANKHNFSEKMSSSSEIVSKLLILAGIEASCFTNLGLSYQKLGQLRRAIEYCEKAVFTSEHKDVHLTAIYLVNLGGLYWEVGLPSKAIEYHNKALEIALKIGDKHLQVTCYANIGFTQDRLGDLSQAIYNVEKALSLSEQVGDKYRQAKCSTSLYYLYVKAKAYEKTKHLQEKALKIAEEIGDKDGLTKCYLNIATSYYEQGKFEKAVHYYDTALKIAEETGNQLAQSQVYLMLGRTYEQKDPDTAYKHYAKSIDLYETIAAGLVDENQKIGLYSLGTHAYDFIVPLCIRLGKIPDAFNYVERSKSKAFHEMLAATKIKPTVKAASEQFKSLLFQEEDLLAKLRILQTRHLRKYEIPVKTGEVDNVLDDLNKIYTLMEKIDPDYVFLRRGRSVTLDRIIEILPSKKDMILVQYFIVKDKMLVFVISNDDENLSQNIHVEIIPISDEEIFRQVRNFQYEISSYFYFKNSGGWIDRTQDMIRLLSDILIKPISKYIITSKKICFVPYGHLHYIPLHALEVNGEPLIKNHVCFYLPSTSVLSFCKNKGNNKCDSCAAFGVIFKEEAEQVAKVFNTKAHIDATQNTVLANLLNDILHFACHGKFDSVDPLSSSIILHNDVLTARSIFDLSISSELVTLSACDTGINENLQGDELIGLTRSILYAGSPSVIVSLWPVYDPSTTQLMITFYKYIQEAKDKATALQIAQKNIMEKEEYSHSYYWAPFILVGDWE